MEFNKINSISILNSLSKMDSNMTEHTVYYDGTQQWCLNGNFHREDGPALIYANGSQCWCLNGVYHREDGPAVTRSDGTQEWWLNGHLHREDGPAIIYADGQQQWYLNGIQHDKISNKISFIINTNHNIKDGF